MRKNTAARTNKRDPRAARTLRRISFVREVKQSFLIICEGVNTEPDYFMRAFRPDLRQYKAVGQGLNTVGLVQKALRMKEEERKKGREYDQCWVVFDKDDFPDRDFNRAIGMAEAVA
ncbi:RloB family protein [Bacteroides ovatus]|nr:RloB family protein [Bacteroides ovatus]